MSTRHKHYNEIVAWAEGKEIQVNAFGEWKDTKDPRFCPGLEYRVKPETITIQLYRNPISELIYMRVEDGTKYDWSKLVCVSDPITVELKS